MNKKGCLLAVALMSLAGAASAAQSYSAAGCGLGSMIFKGKNAKVHLILAATTNGTFGNQTFGISSETLDCTADGVVKNEDKVNVYAAVNFQQLQREMAQGGGEYVSGLASLMGYQTPDQKVAFAKKAQANYVKLFPTATTTSDEMVAALRTL